MESFLFIGLPYISIGLFLFGTIARFRSSLYSISSQSSQFLEHRALRWGSTAWHIGIILILLAHIAVVLAPGLWTGLMSNKTILLVTESTGIALSLLCLIGILVLAVRRLVFSKVQAVTTNMDLVVLGLLFVQVGLGLAVALKHKWGAAWATGTVVPYLWSILTLKPRAELVTEMPLLVKAHVVGGFAFIALIPFSRLIHMLTAPVHYLLREPQLVVWSNLSRTREAVIAQAYDSRRFFLRGFVATGAGATMLAVGVMDKLVRFFQGPKLSKEQEAALMEEKLIRIKSTVEQRELEYERLKNDYIYVCRVSDLDARVGRYFTDFEMRPALAFRDEDGLPLLISAKCTHLGCTIANELSADGKILCPCHISYFDIKTGQPNEGSPAKSPLPHLDWVIFDSQGNLLAQRNSSGVTIETKDLALLLQQGSLYIVKNLDKRV
ncbi:MAG: respiratory nitrate reductase subunit gamma [Acidobacteriota bacterium]|nr:respiratory nitrate reductase subunit gamma [Blastocatellia bacterium]MDW8413774.1 respiratory nitrate reductase subunit gamma [Acidobacteriota bacterium]